MKALNTLIKLNKKKLDNLRLDKEKFIQKLQQLQTKKQQLLLKAESETKLYHHSEYAYMLAQYLRSVDSQKQQYNMMITNTNNQLLHVEKQMHQQFTELKKFEIAKQNKLSVHQHKIRQHEIKSLDEYSSGKYARSCNDIT